MDNLEELPVSPKLGDPPTLAEITEAAKKLQNDKLAGANGLLSKVFKYLDKEHLMHLLKILTQVWNKAYNPET